MLIKTQNSDAIMNYLKTDFLINQNIKGIIENLPWADIYVDDVDDPKGVLVKKDYMHYVYTKDDAFIDNICENYFKEGFFGFSGLEAELAEKIKQRYPVTWESPCTLYYMPEDKLDLSLIKNPVQRIRLEDAEIVNHFYQYKHEHSLEIIQRDITNRHSSAIYIDGEIVCWVLIHDDNSMGIMYTKEEHRHKGYAVDVTMDLADSIIKNGKIPYLQIVFGNDMSPGLAKKCGFVESVRVDWFGIIAGMPKELLEAMDASKNKYLAALPEELRSMQFEDNHIYKPAFNALYSLKEIPNNLEDLEFAKADQEVLKHQWCKAVMKSLGDNTFDAKLREEKLFESVKDNKELLLHMIKNQGEILAASVLHKLDNEVYGLYLPCNLSGYGDSHIRSLLISQTAQAAKDAGCELLVTQVKENEEAYYKNLGFKIACD